MIERRAGELTTYDTRAEAHETVDKEKRYKQIIEILSTNACGYTAKEIAYLLFTKGEIPTPERNFTAPRLTELSYRGIVEPIGKKRCAWTGKTVTVYALRDQRE